MTGLRHGYGVTLLLAERLQIYRCFFTNARPECDFKYFSSSAARCRSDIAMYVLSFHGRDRLACRGVARDVSVAKPERSGFATDYAATGFARHFVASEAWRRGESNPCPRRYSRKHLHVYPMVSFKEPNVAPAHCRLPSVHEIPSPSGAVAPPFD